MNLGNPFHSFGLHRTLLTATGLFAAHCGAASSPISLSDVDIDEFRFDAKAGNLVGPSKIATDNAAIEPSRLLPDPPAIEKA